MQCKQPSFVKDETLYDLRDTRPNCYSASLCEGCSDSYKEILDPVERDTCMVPTGTGNQGKPGKMGRHFPVREKSGNFAQNTGKTGKFE